MIAWDTERAAEKASAAMRYLADYYPEASGSEALHRHQGAAHAAAGLPGGMETMIEDGRIFWRHKENPR